MKKLSLGLIAAIAVSGSLTMLSAAQVVASTGGGATIATNSGAQTQPLIPSEVNANDAVDYTVEKKYTTSEVETAIKDTSEAAVALLNQIKDTMVKKRNPIDGKVSTDDKDVVGSMTHIRASVAEMSRLLEVDRSTFSEHDRIALKKLEEAKKALEKQVADLETKISAVETKIPVAATGIKLGSITIPVLGTSRLQVFPIMDGDQVIGSVRTVCGAYLLEDQLINNKSVNYCVATVWSNSATRVSDVHKTKTTDTYFVGRSEAYVPGEVNNVTIVWDTQPKTSVKGFLGYYNIKDDKTVKAMSYENTLIVGDGTKYAGKDAAVE